MAGNTQRPPNYNSFRSWLVVLGASLSLFCTVGFLNAFGVFQQYYESTLLKGKSASDISWIGSVSIFLLYLGGPFAGTLVDKLGPTSLLILGSGGLLLSIFMLSLCTQYYQIFLAQAVLLGISMSLLFCPTVAVVSRRMPHRRGLALGLAIGGSSIGGIIWPVMLDQMLSHDHISFGWTMRAIGFTMLPLLTLVCLLVVDVPKTARVTKSGVEGQLESGRTTPVEEQATMVESKKASVHDDGKDNAAADGDSRAATDAGNSVSLDHTPAPTSSRFAIFKTPSFALLCAGLAIGYLGLFTPFFYVTPYATSRGIPASTAFYLVAAINAASFFGRVIPGYLADRYGHFNMCILAVLGSSLVAFCWTAARGLTGLIIWSIAYGFTSGAVISLQAACAGKVAPREIQGKAMGFFTGSLAITALVGTPISGALLPQGGYLGLAMWTGATLFVGSFLLIAARLKLDRNIFAAH